MFNQALTIRRAAGDRSGEAITLYQIALLEREGGDLAAARATSEAAIAVVESLRKNITGDQFRTAYMSLVKDYYDLRIDLLMLLAKHAPSNGLAATAFETSERARTRSLSEVLSTEGTDIRAGVDGELLEREKSLRDRFNAQADRLVQLKGTGPAGKELERTSAELEAVEAQIRAKSPRYAALVQPEPIRLEEVQRQLLDSGTLLLEFSLGDERSYVWVVSDSDLAGYELPARREIERAARKFYDLLKTDAEEAQAVAAAGELSRIVLGPVGGRLGSKRLLIVADGILEYIPFAALASPGSPSYEPLMVKHEIVNLPSATVLAALRREATGRRANPKAIAVLADPVFTGDDPRVRRGPSKENQPTPKRSGNNWPERELAVTRTAELDLTRLNGSRQEAAAILELVPAKERMEALDFDASLRTATSPELAQYRIIHFATHGLIDTTRPELSSLVFSLVDKDGRPQDGLLRLHEIYNLKLPAELVVLSACETALGQEVKGEGLIGLIRGFMYAGALRVAASLWKVDDRATAELMRGFYSGLVGPHRLSPAAALRATQMAMWKRPRWRSPYYWAAFVMQGEWN